MINRVYSFIEQHKLLDTGDTIIVGFSGGPDSMFLLHVLAQLRHEKKITLIAAHLDHEWRVDSAHDVEFCRQAAARYNIQFISAKARDVVPNLKKHGSLEAMGRSLRRTFLEQIADRYNAQAIALGHHLQDQEETFFIRLIRGTTLSGLIGMRPKHGRYIRPLLEMNKEDIVRYLQDHDRAYLTDPSNSEEKYLRNRVRLRVIPELEKVDQRFHQNFLRTLATLQAAEHTLEQITRDLFNTMTITDNGANLIDVASLFKQREYVQKRILAHWLILEQVPFVLTERFLDEIIRFLHHAEKKEHMLHHSWRLVKEKGFARLQKH